MIKKAKITKKILIKKMKSYPPFFKKVWLACLKIPKGKTKTYSEIARQIGCPRGARAVAMALKKNPFAPFVPCHRVVRSDGKIGGYSGKGGIKAKVKLLRQEGIRCPPSSPF